MVKALNRDRRRKVTKDSDRQKPTRVIMAITEHNNSEPKNSAENIRPKSFLEGFDEKILETFSLADLVDLLEAAGMMPTGSEEVLPVEESGTAPIQIDVGCIDRIRKSRFCLLVEHFYSGERLIRDLQLEQNPNDVIGQVHNWAVAGLINFLVMTRSLFYHVLGLKRGEGHVRRSKVPSVEAGQRLLTCFMRVDSVAWCVDSDGRLASQPFPGADPSSGLVKKLRELFEGADPARIRRCGNEKCRRVFYAKRADQLCCSRRCNNNRLQREWYSKNGKSAVYERANRRERNR
jgi:hypothetical protein